jgi:hypothetical protein
VVAHITHERVCNLMWWTQSIAPLPLGASQQQRLLLRSRPPPRRAIALALLRARAASSK